jgi:hypothetical protein
MKRIQTERIAATVSAAIAREIERLATEKGLSLSAYVSTILTRHVKEEKGAAESRLP